MIPAIQEIGFGPGTDKAYATLHQATVSFAEMGERTISTQVRIDGDVVPDFDGWEVSFKGERFILNTKDPQAVKDNSTRNSLVDLTFVSWVVNELKRYFFFEPTSIDAGTAIVDKYKASVNVPVEDFAVLFNKVLDYYFDGKVVFSLYMSGQGQYSTDRALVEIDYTYIWDVLVKFFEIYGVRWRIEYDSTNDVYTIKAGWPTTDIDINDHDFEYGYNGGLLRFERQVQDVDIHNILLGRGGEKNIPYRYFKRIDPQNPDWAADPDAIPELSNIYFDRLRDINFRWYVRGWMQNPNHDTSWEDGGYVYPTYTIASDSPYYFAYQKGLTDEKFNPVEYVKDDESIADYGEHWGALDDNDDIFPTIQGVTRAPLGRIDEAVAVSEIVTDDIEAMAENAAIEKSINRLTISLDGETETVFDRLSEEFTIPSGSTGNITYIPFGTDDTYPGLVRFDTDNSTVVAVSDGIEYPIDAIPAGTYRLKLHMVIARSGQAASATGTFGIENIILTTSTQETDAWKPTFDIWVKNIWGTEKQEGETDVQYAERVWLPILGDRVGNEAKIVFSTGFMSVSEDYEFPIVSYPVHDTSKSINGVPSEWRITLRKSDAEFDATGLYIPNASTGGKPVAGDKFFFIGIDMPFRYVTLAEEDLNTYKSAQLDTEAAISPTWIMNLDKVRVHTLEDQEYGLTLAERLAAGGKVWIKDKRFTPGERLQLYVQSITYTWNEPTVESPYIVPDIEVVLSDKVVAVDSVVQRIQNDVSSIKNQYARISDVEAVVRSVAEPIFLKKTGESDSSDSPTQFSSKVTSKGFRQGGVGGTGWGIYRDNTSVWAEAEAETRTRRLLRAVTEEQNTEGDTVFEADRIVVRKELQVNSLVINQISYLGGKEIISAAKIEVSKVIETDNGYVCYFDQRRNSVANNFVVNDIAMGQVFDPYNAELRYYKALVTAVDIDSITISKTQKVGSGVPRVGDVIVQYGNTTQSGRQYVIVRDVVGGGYERMLSGLNSLNADGDEYYFAGRESSGTGPRWFVGSHEQNGDYAEYENGVLTIKANVVFKQGQVIPGLSDLTDDVEALEYLKTALPKSDTIITGGLILSKVIALRDANNSVMSGINGDTSLSNIAAWYGGPMADKEASPTPASYAKSLFRFDGSGYLAGGNIGWENDGDGHIPGISWETTGGVTSVTIGANVKLEQTGGTDSSVTDLVTAVKSFPSTYLSKTDAAELYHPLGGSTTLVSFKIGGATLTWHPQVGSTPGYIELDSAFVTNGDQIVIDGDPSQGGGGGGATMLRQLDDVYHNASGVLRKNGGSVADGDLLSYDSASSRWVALDQASVTTDLSDYYNKSQTNAQISSAISALNLGTAATYGIGFVASGNTGLVTGGDVWTAIDELPEPMVFKGSLGTGGTITSLPAASSANEGFTYKVITAGTYLGTAAKVGDTFISNGSSWILIPSGDEPEGTVTSVGLSMPTGFSVSSSPITSSGTLTVAFASGYSLPTTAKQSNWDTAYGWGNHANAGYLLATTAASTYQPIISDLADIREGANLGSSAYQLPTGGIPKNHLAQTVQNSLALADSSIQAVYDMTLKVGAATIGTFESGVEDKTLTITAQNLYDAIGSTKYHPYGGSNSLNTFVMGGATFTWHPAVGSTPGYLELNSPFLTQGDQIVIDGTPGGGGGGGATTLAGLDDTNITNPQSGQMLAWNGTKWVNTNAPTGSITSVSLAAGATNGTLHLVVNGTAQSDVAVTGLKALAYKDSLAFSEITGTASASQIPTLAISKISGLQTALDGKQPLDADLTAIAGLTGTSGFLKKTAANTWALDTNTYITGITSTMVTNALGYTPANATALANYVTLATAQTISALKTMTAGLKVSGRTNGSTGGDDEGITIDFADNGFGGLTIGNPTGVRSVFYFRNTEGAIPFWRYNNGTTSFDINHPAKSGTIALTSDVSTAIEALDSSTETVSSGYFITGVTITDGKITARTQSNSISGSAARLTTVSKTAWGQTYWTANGVPDTISGDMSSVGNITPSTTLTKNLGSSSLFWGNAYVNKLYLTSSIYFYTETVGGTVCVRLNAPFITAGDQIVISGTPGGGGGGGATTLAGLDDVAITSVANGQLLQYNGSKWVNVAASSVGGVTSVAGYTGAVTAAQISSAIGLSGYVTLAGTETISGLKTFTSGLRVSGRVYSGGDDEGIVITWASNNYASLVLGSHNAERSVFTIHSGDAPKWVYNNGTNGYTITHPAKNGTIALTSDIPNVPSWAMNATKPSYTFAEITDKITHTNEFNFIPTSFDGHAWFNFRSSDESTANVDEYRFGKGSATFAYASIRALSFIKDGGTSSQFLKADGSVDTNTYLTGNQTITLSGDVSGSGTTSIAVTIGQGKVTNAMLAGSIANGKLANSSITINGSSTSLGGSFSTASITAGTAGQSTASTGVSFSIPYVTMNAYGIVTGYGTHTHTISAQDLYDTIGSTKYAAYNADGYLPLSGGVISGTTNAPFGINTTNTMEVGIRFTIGGTSKAFFGYHTTYGSYIYNYASQTTLGIKDDGTPHYSGSTLWHGGNSGTTSYPWACSTLTAATTATISGVEIGNTNEINGVSAGAYTQNIHLNYRSTGYVSLAYGGGNVGVGVLNPSYKLHVVGSAYADNLTLNGSINGVSSIDSLISFNTTSSIVSLASSSYFVENKPHYFRLNTNASWRGGMFWGSSGQESLAFVAANTGTTFRFCVGSDIANWTNATWQTATSQLVISNTGINVTGTIISTGDQVVSSDATLKTNLKDITYSVADIAKAPAVTFDWKDGRGRSAGSIAQYWKNVLPELVHGEEGNMSLAYGQLALVNTILLARQSESHEERIARLEKENAELKEEVKRLRMN